MTPVVKAALSGCVWGGIAYGLAARFFEWTIWAGVAASPLIGMVAGVASRRFDRLSWLAQALVALITLYGAAALFGFSTGVADSFTRPRSAVAGAPVIENILATWWGLTFTGYVVVLWPLAYLNHRLIAQAWNAAGSAAGRNSLDVRYDDAVGGE